MNRLIVLVFVSFIMGSCSVSNRFVVTRPGEEPVESIGKLAYSLPRNIIEVSLHYEKVISIPGPYRKFSSKYLGISNVIETEKTEWDLISADLRIFEESDPEHLYYITILKGNLPSAIYGNMIESRLILDPVKVQAKYLRIPDSESVKIPAISETSMKRNLLEASDTLYKTVIMDSTFVKIPILRKQREAKTPEQKAEEAANLIIKVRKRRLKLVDGEYNVFPEGIALETALKELDRTEKEYVSLFTGREIRERYIRSFILVPAGGEQKIEFAAFSESEGLMKPSEGKGRMLSVEVQPAEGYNYNQSLIIDNSLKNTFLYRMPGICSIRVMDGETPIFEGRISLFQSGRMLGLTLPEK